MQWFDLCQTPGALSGYYSSPPSLEQFEVVEADLMHHSPSLHLMGIVPVPPDSCRFQGNGPKPDGVYLTFAFWELLELSVEGFPRDATGSLGIAANDKELVAFDFNSKPMTCRGTAKKMTVENIAP
jgi:hypothetical protein